MKRIHVLFVAVVVSSVFTSCATIVGGSKYHAIVEVPNHPDAKIEYNGSYKGTGSASFLVERRKANEFSVTISKDTCAPQTRTFTEREFRGGAFVGTVLGWTGAVPGTYILLPWGILVDGLTGAWWKPSERETGVAKRNYDNFIYTIDYTGCEKTSVWK